MSVFAPYPMTVAQMAEWAEQVSVLTTHECAKALHTLNRPRVIPIERR